MAVLPSDDWDAAEALATIPFVNPFLEERVKLERRAIGRRYVGVGPVLTLRPGLTGDKMYPELPSLRERCEELYGKMRERLKTGQDATPGELEVYERLAFFLMYLRFTREFESLLESTTDEYVEANFWPKFAATFEDLFRIESRRLPTSHRPEVIFAICYQKERAYAHIFERIVGSSLSATRLRAEVWESIFTHDILRYIRVLHSRISHFPVLIVGPSGSGKELVASAIANSSFIPFDSSQSRFHIGNSPLYVPVNLAALSPTLIESELFGHVKNAFTGAVDRVGWLEKCERHGSVFLDEIGELDGSIQVKLLRVLETRRFERVGSTKPRVFEGRIISATNRDLTKEMEAGRFRHDLYFRLCANQVTTPSLARQLSERPDDLVDLVRFAVRGALDLNSNVADEEVEQMAAEAIAWIQNHLGGHYHWPGNFRELSQCVRNVIVHGCYIPTSRDLNGGRHAPVEELVRAVREGMMTSNEVISRYYALVLQKSNGNFREAGRRLDVDWKTVKDRHDRAFYERLNAPKSDL